MIRNNTSNLSLPTNSWHYTTPQWTGRTTVSTDQTGDNSWLKAGLLAKASNDAVRGYMKNQAEKEAAEGAKNVLSSAEKFGGTGMGGTAGELGGDALGQSSNGEWALGAAKPMQDSAGNWSLDATKHAAQAGEWAPAGEATQNIGGVANDAVSNATSAAEQAGQTASDLGTQAYTDAVADAGSNLAEQAATDAATEAATEGVSSAASAIPIAGTALNVGANLAQGNYGAAAGAASGAALGSVIPGVGTALGGTIGGLIGSFL